MPDAVLRPVRRYNRGKNGEKTGRSRRRSIGGQARRECFDRKSRSVSTMAVMASTTGTILGTRHGSCLPGVELKVSDLGLYTHIVFELRTYISQMASRQ